MGVNPVLSKRRQRSELAATLVYLAAMRDAIASGLTGLARARANLGPMGTPGVVRGMVLVALCAASLGLTGCPNPNAIGVQQTGTINARCLLASNNQPVVDALVTVNSIQTCRTDSDGKCTIQQVPVGPQSVSAAAAGLQGGPVSTTVIENQSATVSIPMSPSNG
ncbi:MAG: carboxypeptidase regulatory-like domain-containing protein [Candidatus Eremiobacteraeota bacterium]|nr:carboxypeptidase regulatory-like domain-containing protein [Candidatus Eremiobacteraeota bacterium]MBC5828018.1 carboxypeptidase regulatory-like domain-containing protein [Candidatus Eremiobacteraeota bacterium]